MAALAAEGAEVRWWAAPAWADLAHQAAEDARASVAEMGHNGGPLVERALDRAVTQAVLQARCQTPVAQLLLPRVRRCVPQDSVPDAELLVRIETAAEERCGTRRAMERLGGALFAMHGARRGAAGMEGRAVAAAGAALATAARTLGTASAF